MNMGQGNCRYKRIGLSNNSERCRIVRAKDSSICQWVKPFMMLAVDMTLNWDSKQREIVNQYNRNRMQFKPDASSAWKKLTELGCNRL